MKTSEFQEGIALPKRTYIFDLDGTLVNLPVNWNALKEELATKLGIEDQLPPLYQLFNDNLTNRPDLLKIAFDVMDQDELKAVRDAELIDGALDVLERLAKDSSLALVTLQGKAACDTLLKRFDLSRFFEIILTREDALDRTKQITLVLTMMHTSAGNATMIGDRDNDMVCAKKVGLSCVFIGMENSRIALVSNYSSMRQYLSAL